MNFATALILVIHAHIMVGMSGPDLPDDFGGSGGAGRPTISFSTVAAGPSQLVRTKGSKVVTERWIVSEPWCKNCPAAKARFLATGGDESHVITIAEAKQRHGKSIGSIPHEFTTESKIETEYLNPAHYRYATSMQTFLNGTGTPSKDAILKHLRTGGPHQGKHWQAWHLESWNVQQLYALHDDDHADAVPTFDEADSSVEATIENAQPSLNAVAAALAVHLLTEQKEKPVPEAYSGLFDIEVESPDGARSWLADLLSKQSTEFPAAGVSASWKGSDRTISVTPGAVRISPGVTVAVKKFGMSVSTSLTGCSFDDGLTWVKLELKNAPDLTVRFK